MQAELTDGQELEDDIIEADDIQTIITLKFLDLDNLVSRLPRGHTSHPSVSLPTRSTVQLQRQSLAMEILPRFRLTIAEIALPVHLRHRLLQQPTLRFQFRIRLSSSLQPPTLPSRRLQMTSDCPTPLLRSFPMTGRSTGYMGSMMGTTRSYRWTGIVFLFPDPQVFSQPQKNGLSQLSRLRRLIHCALSQRDRLLVQRDDWNHLTLSADSLSVRVVSIWFFPSLIFGLTFCCRECHVHTWA